MLVCKSQFLMLATSWLLSCSSMVVFVFVAFFGVACFLVCGSQRVGCCLLTSRNMVLLLKVICWMLCLTFVRHDACSS